MKLHEAKKVSDLANLVILAEESGAPEDFVCERYRMLRFAIPEDSILASTLDFYDRPDFRSKAALTIARLAMREANGDDISVNGLSPESRSAVEKYLSERN